MGTRRSSFSVHHEADVGSRKTLRSVGEATMTMIQHNPMAATETMAAIKKDEVLAALRNENITSVEGVVDRLSDFLAGQREEKRQHPLAASLRQLGKVGSKPIKYRPPQVPLIIDNV
jgi:hypothetical protein